VEIKCQLDATDDAHINLKWFWPCNERTKTNTKYSPKHQPHAQKTTAYRKKHPTQTHKKQRLDHPDRQIYLSSVASSWHFISTYYFLSWGFMRNLSLVLKYECYYVYIYNNLFFTQIPLQFLYWIAPSIKIKLRELFWHRIVSHLGLSYLSHPCKLILSFDSA